MPDLEHPGEETLTLIERKHAYGDVDTYIFRPARKIAFDAGQYAHVRLSGMPPDERQVREFSFASAPHEEEIWFGVDSRSGSSYQKALKALQPGDTVVLFKIKGHMHWPPEGISDVVMIAGGVGATPFRSEIRDLAERKLPIAVTLIHVSRDAFLYGEEFREMPIRYIPIRRDALQGQLLACIEDHPDAMYYIAGSLGFVDSVKEILLSAGILRMESDVFKGLVD